jgi:hypothetical protein
VTTLALVNEEKPGHWKCPMKNSDEVGDCSFTNGHEKKIEEKLALIIANALCLEESRMEDWVGVVEMMTWIFTALLQ